MVSLLTGSASVLHRPFMRNAIIRWQQRDRGEKQKAKNSYDNADPICNAWYKWRSVDARTKKRKSNSDDWDCEKPQSNTVESLKISRNLVIAICLNHDLEKHNSKCEKRKLGKCYYVHGIKR